MDVETIELIQPTLGLRPFVLVEYFDGADGPDDLRADVQGGGGISTTEDIRVALSLALENLPDNARLKAALAAIEPDDTNYEVRYVLVLEAMAAAASAGLPVGISLDPAEPGWPVFYIELPTGQVSWHMPAHTTAYDGHSTAEKYQRINAYVAATGAA